MQQQQLPRVLFSCWKIYGPKRHPFNTLKQTIFSHFRDTLDAHLHPWLNCKRKRWYTNLQYTIKSITPQNNVVFTVRLWGGQNIFRENSSGAKSGSYNAEISWYTCKPCPVAIPYVLMIIIFDTKKRFLFLLFNDLYMSSVEYPRRR